MISVPKQLPFNAWVCVLDLEIQLYCVTQIRLVEWKESTNGSTLFRTEKGDVYQGSHLWDTKAGAFGSAVDFLRQYLAKEEGLLQEVNWKLKDLLATAELDLLLADKEGGTLQ